MPSLSASFSRKYSAVAILHPVRNLIIDLRPASRRCPIQNIGRIDAIDVIVTYNPNFLPFFDFPFKSDPPPALPEAVPDRQAHACPIQILPDLIVTDHIPVADDAASQDQCRTLCNPENLPFSQYMHFSFICAPPRKRLLQVALLLPAHTQTSHSPLRADWSGTPHPLWRRDISGISDT